MKQYTDETVIKVSYVKGRYNVMRCVATIGDDNLPHRTVHSPTGFSYGYGGSGPADLALSILDAALLDDKRTRISRGTVKLSAWALHQRFKWEFVAKWPQSKPVSMTVGDVRNWAKTIQQGTL